MRYSSSIPGNEIKNFPDKSGKLYFYQYKVDFTAKFHNVANIFEWSRNQI